jgi:ribonuclease VapC
MIVDSSALISLFRKESDAETPLDRILNAERVRVSAATLVEATMVAADEGGADDFAQLIRDLGIEIMPFDANPAAHAIEGFMRFGKGRHPARLNLGDLFSYALARATNESLLFKGGDFARTDVTAA